MVAPGSSIHPKADILIIGGGKFGSRAAVKLHEQSPQSSITLVEKEKVDKNELVTQVIEAEGIEWFAENFNKASSFTHIIPALPIHLAGEWVKRVLLNKGYTVQMQEISSELLDILPNPYRLNKCQAAISHADFHCPPNCDEPSKICTYTKKKRPTPLYKILGTLHTSGCEPVIIQSRQFSRGVGGFYPADLWNFLDRIIINRNKTLLAGTACKCHGIVESFSVT